MKGKVGEALLGHKLGEGREVHEMGEKGRLNRELKGILVFSRPDNRQAVN